MSKHHPARAKHWREIMEQGRRARPAGAGRGHAGGGGAAAPAPAARAQQAQRRPRPGKPAGAGATASAGAAGAGAAGAGAAGAGAAGAGAAEAGSASAAAAPARPRAPQLDGLGLPYITLAQRLKKLSLAGSGGEAKAMVRAGGIRVNGADEARPGRKLHQGDKVTISGHDHHVSLG